MWPKLLTKDDLVKVSSLPFMAIVQGVAQGDHGNRVGVWGFSETNVGVYAQSDSDIGLYATGPNRAALLEGVVEITKSLIVGDSDVIARIRSLEEKFAALQGQVATLQGQVAALSKSVRTNQGVAVQAPGTRPMLNVTQSSPAAGGAATFTIQGSMFPTDGAVEVHAFNAATSNDQRWTVTSVGGNFFDGGRSIGPGLIKGSELEFYATDRSPDPNDDTGLLWTIHTTWVVS